MTAGEDPDTGAAGAGAVGSIVRRGTGIRGQVDLSGMLRIDGEFHGEVRATGRIVIGRTGRIERTVHAGTVIVAGTVRGDAVATELVELRSTAIMIGSICTPRLIVEEGGRFCGRCSAGAGDDRGTEPRRDPIPVTRPA